MSTKDTTVTYDKIDTAHFFKDKSDVVMDYIVTNTIKNFPLDLQSHAPSEINICFEGEGVLGTNDSRHLKVKAGDIVIVNPYANHGVGSISGCSFYIIGFSNLIFQLNDDGVLLVKADDVESICKLVELMKLAAKKKQYQSNEKLLQFLTKSLLELVKVQTSIGNSHYEIGPGGSLTNRVADYIDKNFKDDISIESLSKMFNCSRSTLVHSFKKDYGVSVMNYLRERRLKEILFWLQISERGVTELANDHGFDTMPYFFKYFKKQIGMTPYQYRLKVRKEKAEKSADSNNK